MEHGFGLTAAIGTCTLIGRFLNQTIMGAMKTTTMGAKKTVLSFFSPLNTGMTEDALTKTSLCAAKEFVQVQKTRTQGLHLLFPEGCKTDKCIPECASGWEEMNGDCYFWSQEKLFWGAAEEKCRSYGGHLASVTSQDVHDYLQQNVMTNDVSVSLYVFHNPTHVVGQESRICVDRSNRRERRG